MRKQTHPIACSIPKLVKIKYANGKVENVIAYPAYLFEVIELVKADQVKMD